MDRAERDFFSDPEIVADPGSYFSDLRAKGRVVREPHHGAVMVSGYDEALEVLAKPAEVLSNAVSVAGPIPPVPFEAKGGDIRAELEAHRDELPWAEHLISFDGQKHAEHRMLVTRLITPKRLKQNEEYLRGLSDKLIDRFIGRGRCEVVSEYAHATSTLVITDLLGVPESDRDELLVLIGAPPTQIGGDEAVKIGTDPLLHLHDRFLGYLKERQANPRDDAMSELAAARYTDGSPVDIHVLARLACFLFGAGQDTSARLITAALRILAEDPALQARLRTEHNKIADFVEETARFEAPVKVVHRLAQVTDKVAGVEVPAGAVVTTALWSANRDPQHFPDPDRFDIDRPALRDNLTFSRGAHACPGAPLARLETRVAVERFLDRMSDIRIDEGKHGPPGARRFDYEPTYMLRSLSQLHLEFAAA